MKYIFSLAAFMCLFIHVGTAESQEPKDLGKNMVVVRGRVVTPKRSPINNTRLRLDKIENGKRVVLNEMISLKNGDFAIAVPKGVYRFSIEDWAGYLPPIENDGDCRPKCIWFGNEFRRADFDLSQGGSFYLLAVPLKDGFYANKTMETVVKNESKYDVIGSGPLNIMIRYVQKEVRDGQVFYDSPNDASTGSFYPIISLTYDRFSIFADELVVDETNGQIAAGGKIIIHNGLEEFAVKSLQMNIRSAPPSLHYEK